VKIDLIDLGFDDFFIEKGIDKRSYARVIREHKERYIVLNESGEYAAEITGNLRYMASSRADFPAVGDWVIVTIIDNKAALILKILPRKSILERRAVNVYGEKQIIGANIDFAFIVISLDRDFNLNRVERYLSLVYAGRIKPIVLLSKSDLINKSLVQRKVKQVKERTRIEDVVACSNETGDGLKTIKNIIMPGKTYCFIGSSGVGKSTLINCLQGEEVLKTGSLSESTGKGIHTTTYRELRYLSNGGLLIDSPGMREIGVTEKEEGVKNVFDQIRIYSQACKFNDCTHTGEPGCAVQEAIQRNEIDPAALEHYKKLEREVERFTASVAEKRKKDKKFGKHIKQVVKDRKNKKY